MTQYYNILIDFDDKAVAERVSLFLQEKISSRTRALKEGFGVVKVVSGPDILVGLRRGVFRLRVSGRFERFVDRVSLISLVKGKVRESVVFDSVLSVLIETHLCTVVQAIKDHGCRNEIVFSYKKA